MRDVKQEFLFSAVGLAPASKASGDNICVKPDPHRSAQ
jgi:hypothetical protein